MLHKLMRYLLLPMAYILFFLLPAIPPVADHQPPPGETPVQIVPELSTAPKPVASSPPPEAHIIEDCTVTWYTADTCGKAPDHPAYGITASGLPVEEGVTCAVDPEVIPLGAEVRVLFSDGTVGTFRATDTGVRGNWVDIYTPDYDYAVQCGVQTLTVYWAAPRE